MAGNASGKPAASTVPPADLTKDIDDDWADDDETGGVPAVTAKAPSEKPTTSDSESSSKPSVAEAGATMPKGKRSISGTLPTQQGLKHDSGAPATEEIDSDWPDEDQAASVPEIPKQAKLPDLERKLASSPHEETTSGPAKTASTIPPTSANFEKAAQRLAQESDFSASWGAGKTEPPAKDEEEASGEAAKQASERPAAAKSSRSEAAASAGEEKKRSPLVGIAVAAAAVALIGFALHSRRSAEPVAEPTAEKAAPAKTVVQAAKDPDTRGATAAVAKGDQETKAAEDDKAAEAAEAAEATEDDKAGDDTGESDDAAKPNPAKATEKVLVHLAITPPDAEIYHKGKRIGRGEVRVEVDPNDKMLLLLVRDGYYPRKAVLDGTEPYVNIGMRTKPETAQSQPAKPKAAPAPKKAPASKPPSSTRPAVPRAGGQPPSSGVAPPIAR